MKCLGHILIVAGSLGVALGLGSFIYPLLQKPERMASSVHVDAEGDSRVYVVLQKFACGIGGGTLAILVGAYIRGDRPRDL